MAAGTRRRSVRASLLSIYPALLCSDINCLGLDVQVDADILDVSSSAPFVSATPCLFTVSRWSMRSVSCRTPTQWCPWCRRRCILSSQRAASNTSDSVGLVTFACVHVCAFALVHYRCHLVTASYESPTIAAMHHDALDADIAVRCHECAAQCCFELNGCTGCS